MNLSLASFFLKLSRVVPQGLLSKDASLKKNLTKASMKSGVQVYVGLIVFASLVTVVATFGVCFLLLSLLGLEMLDAFFFSLLIGLGGGLIAFGIGYAYPSSVAYSRGNKIDSNLSNIAHFMAVLASSGMTPENVFRSLARVGEQFSVGKEVVEIIGEIELMGANLHSSLIRISEVSPSRKFGTMLNGIVSTSNMGGDLSDYLNDQARKFKEEQMGRVRRFIENLAVVAEGYVAFMVAAPLMLIIMLSVMSLIGGGVTFGGMDPSDLLNMLTFVGVPLGVAFLIFMVDSMTPMR